MRFRKRIMAGFLCICMVLFSNTYISYAMDMETVPEGCTGTEEETSPTDATPLDADLDILTPQEDGEEETESETTALNWLVLGSDYIEAPDTQYVVADIGDGSLELTSAEITYENDTTGDAYRKTASVISGTSVVFYLNHSDSTETSVYRITGISYVIGGETYTAVMDEVGIEAVYGVNTTVDVNPTAWAVDEESADMAAEGEEDLSDVADLIITDASGNELTPQTFADALDAAGADELSAAGSSSDGNIIIVLSPGHSGSDPGAVRTWNGVTYTERDLNLKIAEYCREELEKHSGITVYMTRYDNTTECTLEGRVEYAESVGADLYVSIHLNSSTGTTAKGVEVHIPTSDYDADQAELSTALGQAILDKLVALGLTNRGLVMQYSTAGYTNPDGTTADYLAEIRYCKWAGIPGVLVEHAFLSNQSDAETYLGSETALKALGVADAEGILEYINQNPQGPATVYNGVDYSAVYDYEYYINKYADLKKAYGDDDKAALKHFVTYGMKEGRQASANFNVTSYAYKYADLRRAYKNDLQKYYMHYINYGKKEGRTATGVTTMQGCVSTYGGMDYSAVYNGTYYYSKYSDLRKAYGLDDEALLKHFITYGMKEGRQASADFNVISYRYKYRDLRLAYGSDLQKYYLHYIKYGKKEGRTATGTTSVQNPVTTWDGVDYSAVYDYTYYINNNADVKRAYGDDDIAVLKHFITYGMKEGRQASADFNVSVYRCNYLDLQKAYGSDLQKYYQHYIKYGKKEKRVANKLISTYTSIMGETTTSVTQMVSYYNSCAEYPSYYAASDAPTIETFCQIYIEECEAEGIRAEVAFSQAMKETGFLRFGGTVKIEQYNFAGLGATDSGGTPAAFSTVREGIRAHVQHLKAYASTEKLNNACVDPRFSLVTRGVAPYVEWLGVQENPSGKGWATAANYGYSIKNDYMVKLLSY